jgi:formylglycine-generating enzyme required for sulfatase activity
MRHGTTTSGRNARFFRDVGLGVYGVLIAGCTLSSLTPAARSHAAARGDHHAPSDGAAKADTITLPGKVPLEMMSIRAGTFLMGQNAGEQDAYPNNEKPQHRVTLSHGFWMGRCKVTKGQWRAVMGAAP